VSGLGDVLLVCGVRVFGPSPLSGFCLFGFFYFLEVFCGLVWVLFGTVWVLFIHVLLEGYLCRLWGLWLVAGDKGFFP
jgi:hypothetical protein